MKATKIIRTEPAPKWEPPIDHDRELRLYLEDAARCRMIDYNLDYDTCLQIVTAEYRNENIGELNDFRRKALRDAVDRLSKNPTL